jgi:hypothetical protein
MSEEKYLSAKEFKKLCNLSITTIHTMRKNGLIHKIEKIPGRKPRFVFRLSDVEKFRNLGVHDV